MTVPISQQADDLIVASEVGSKAQYVKKYSRPEWPGGMSGVTVGIGYDLGFATPAKIKSDWGDKLAGSMIDAMLPCSGLTGDVARTMTAQVRSSIDVPWDAAISVYEHVDIPQWTQRVCNLIPGAEKLHPHGVGALTSLAYNRGASFRKDGDRYREMRAIRSHIMVGELDLVDDEIRNMKRLWGSDQRGLLIRRDKEADLWNLGLTAAMSVPKAAPAAEKSKPKEDPAPLVPPQAPGGAGESAGGTVVTGAAAGEAARSGLDPAIIAAIVVAGIVITIGAVAYFRYRRSQIVLARAKG